MSVAGSVNTSPQVGFTTRRRLGCLAVPNGLEVLCLHFFDAGVSVSRAVVTTIYLSLGSPETDLSGCFLKQRRHHLLHAGVVCCCLWLISPHWPITSRVWRCHRELQRHHVLLPQRKHSRKGQAQRDCLQLSWEGYFLLYLTRLTFLTSASAELSDLDLFPLAP